MKRLSLLPLLVMALVGCQFLFPGSPLKAERLSSTDTQWSASRGPTLILSAGLAGIQSWEPAAACVRVVVGGDLNRGLRCPVPDSGLLVKVTSPGAVTGQIVNGLEPITPPITLP